MSLNFYEESHYSRGICELIQKNYISVKEFLLLSESQRLNLESRAIRRMIYQDILSIAEAIQLSTTQKQNFESSQVMQLIEAGVINWQQVYLLLDNERELIQRDSIRNILLTKLLTLDNLKKLSKQQIENLQSFHLFELWQNSEISWDTFLNMDAFFSYILGHQQFQKLKTTYELRTTDLLELVNFYDHSVTPGSPYSLYKNGTLTFSQAIVSLLNWVSLVLMPCISELVKCGVLSLNDAKKLSLQQVYNLEIPAVQYYLKKHKIYVYMFLDLTVQQIMNLESKEIFTMLKDDLIELNDVLQLTYAQLQNLQSLPVQLLIKHNQLTVTEAKNLKVSHRLYLERPENLQKIQNGSFSLREIATDFMISMLIQSVDLNFFVKKDLSPDALNFLEETKHKVS